VEGNEEEFLIHSLRRELGSSGSELPGWASWTAGAFRKLTDGKLPADTAAKKSSVSYW
jgi:hypothetical protein